MLAFIAKRIFLLVNYFLIEYISCAEWLLLANSCFSQSLTAVTVYANIGLAGIALAFSQTKLRVLFTSEDLLPSVSFVFVLHNLSRC